MYQMTKITVPDIGVASSVEKEEMEEKKEKWSDNFVLKSWKVNSLEYEWWLLTLLKLHLKANDFS